MCRPTSCLALYRILENDTESEGDEEFNVRIVSAHTVTLSDIHPSLVKPDLIAQWREPSATCGVLAISSTLSSIIVVLIVDYRAVKVLATSMISLPASPTPSTSSFSSAQDPTLFPKCKGLAISRNGKHIIALSAVKSAGAKASLASSSAWTQFDCTLISFPIATVPPSSTSTTAISTTLSSSVDTSKPTSPIPQRLWPPFMQHQSNPSSVLSTSQQPSLSAAMSTIATLIEQSHSSFINRLQNIEDAIESHGKSLESLSRRVAALERK
jgi:hypothetical protein